MSMVYFFVFNEGPKHFADFRTWAEINGVRLLNIYYANGNLGQTQHDVVAEIPDGKLKPIKTDWPTSWFRKVE